MQYICDQCKLKFTTSKLIRFHKNTIHNQRKQDKVRYKCEQCEYSVSMPQKISKHKQEQHEGGIYGCAKCAFKTFKEENIGRHKLRDGFN